MVTRLWAERCGVCFSTREDFFLAWRDVQMGPRYGALFSGHDVMRVNPLLIVCLYGVDRCSMCFIGKIRR